MAQRHHYWDCQYRCASKELGEQTWQDLVVDWGVGRGLVCVEECLADTGMVPELDFDPAADVTTPPRLALYLHPGRHCCWTEEVGEEAM